ncbi:NADPH-dependent FMN reductase [Jannaschia ovalis]|uniref:NAD(P)H-dependent oxidoreductase n=1 Tax=Jannaschia ovalis TaxID=3038773 RepID=A0ABY8L8L9_9RHOB|nr:NAD(P)H-dependent oxidoreductase [Jannaschia sp. GRR-S6-38]WGH77614.1 NAD(P)H-dependent oxidoreductase [Jannaschia sp. GRR-S6-38]
MSNLLGLCGSLRAPSFNRKLMIEAGRIWGGLDEADLRLPLYDGDSETAEGIPEAVTRLAGQIAAAPAVIVVTPEYNKAPSGVLKNALDWISRTDGKPLAGKPVAIMSATAGRSGGERTQAVLRLMLQPFGPDLLQGPEVLVGQAQAQFDAGGRLTNERNLEALKALMAALKARAGV